MRKTLLANLGVAAFASAMLLGAVPAAAGTLDQSQLDPGNGYEPIGGSYGAAQTFTAGLSGPLDQVDLTLDRIADGYDLLVEVRTVDSGGTPTGTILAATAISWTHVPTQVVGVPPVMTAVTFSAPATVTAGVRYAIVLPGISPGTRFGWWLTAGNPYSGGMTFTSSTDSFSSLTNYDYAFRIFVLQSPPGQQPTGLRAGALKKCKTLAKKNAWRKERLRKCKRKARRLPV